MALAISNKQQQQQQKTKKLLHLLSSYCFHLAIDFYCTDIARDVLVAALEDPQNKTAASSAYAPVVACIIAGGVGLQRELFFLVGDPKVPEHLVRTLGLGDIVHPC